MRTSLALTALIALGSIAAPAVQERVKKKGPKDFPALMADANKAWDSKTYGKCSEALAKASALVSEARRETILAAFPAPPADWTFKAEKVDAAAAAFMSGMTGTVVEGNYKGPSNARVTLQAMVDSPLVQMMSMMLANPKMLGEDAELIMYGEHKAILQKNSADRWELTIVIGNDLIKADGRGISDDDLLKMIDQAVVDKLRAAMDR